MFAVGRMESSSSAQAGEEGRALSSHGLRTGDPVHPGLGAFVHTCGRGRDLRAGRELALRKDPLTRSHLRASEAHL